MRFSLNKDSGGINFFSLVIICLVVFISITFGKNIAYLPLSNSILLVIGVVIFTTTFLNPKIGLFIIIFSMLLSPEIVAGAVPGRNIKLRLEDFLILITTFTWLVRTGINKQLFLLKKTPLNLPIAIYIAICLLFTLRGILTDTVIPIKGLFYFIKYIEYFLIYFMFINLVENKRQAKVIIFMLIATCFITAGYANLHIGQERVTAPFQEEEGGEPNTLAGYLTIMIALIMGIVLHSEPGKKRLFLGALVLFIIPAFLFTLSRTGYIAIVPMWISLIVFSKRKLLLTFLLVVAVGFSMLYLPKPIENRIKTTFKGEHDIEIGVKNVVTFGKTLDASTSARIRSWELAIERTKSSPFFGYGITGLGLVDGQYILVLAETGVIGLIVFIFLLWAIFKQSYKIFLNARDKFFKGISLGFLSGFIGLLFFNFGASGFILIRVMEPFWCLAAIVMLIPQFEAEEALAQKDISYE